MVCRVSGLEYRRWGMWGGPARQESANSRTGQHDDDESFSGGVSPVEIGVWGLLCGMCRVQNLGAAVWEVWGLDFGIQRFGFWEDGVGGGRD